LSRDCRRIVASDWYRRVFATRLAPRHQAVPEFETTAQGCRIATSIGRVLTGRGADIIVIDDPLKPEEALSEAHRQPAIAEDDQSIVVDTVLARAASTGAAARRCTRRASHCRCWSRSAGRSANPISPANTSRCQRH
jgi:hypothetical protein